MNKKNPPPPILQEKEQNRSEVTAVNNQAIKQDGCSEQTSTEIEYGIEIIYVHQKNLQRIAFKQNDFRFTWMAASVKHPQNLFG